MNRMLHVVAVAIAGLALASVISACGGAADGDTMKGRSDFYEDGHETGSSYPYTKPGK
ncbi:MAG: hypothetical protein ACREVK_03760 [Gammaproteobacteria bacterium]